MGTVAHVVFRYDDDPNSDEAVRDLDALDAKLRPGATMERNGRSWEVIRIDVEPPTGIDDELPTWRVYLKACRSSSGS